MAENPARITMFGAGQQNVVPREEFGNKASGIATMAALGIPVPPGFALSVLVCEDYFTNGEKFPKDAPALLRQGILFLERATGTVFGGERRPLLVSVRSGAAASMPGIMDTILNIGLTPVTVRGLLARTGNPRFVYDTYRRFLQNFGTSMFGHNPFQYAALMKSAIGAEGVPDERELDYQSLRLLCRKYEQLYIFPDQRACLNDAYRQLEQGTIAVIRSWESPRAVAFRNSNLVSGATGTAVTVQPMVFGNMGASSGAGVAFTRNPWTGVKDLLIDFRFGAQGEDVVSGECSATTQNELAEVMPEVYRELLQIAARLETHFCDMQDIEFTVQEGRLFLLQSRSGKRAPLAALRIAVELCESGIISHAEAIERLKTINPDTIIIQTVLADEPPLAVGISASGGVAYGTIAFSSERAEEDALRGPVILVRETASPDDIAGIDAAAGLLTSRGARTSHAAVVARQMGKVCVVNCTDLLIDAQKHRCTIGNAKLREGDIISIDGDNGAVYRGRVGIKTGRPDDLIAIVRRWQMLPY